MKRIYLTIFLMLGIWSSLFSQIRHNNFYLWEADSSSQTWQIVGIERDTSEWYLSNPTMTFYCWPRDTTTGANGDSVAITLYIQLSHNKDLVYQASDTLAITSDSTVVKWFTGYDSLSISGSFFRMILQGEAANDKDAGSLIDIGYDGYPAK